jgi:hypothetical protein
VPLFACQGAVADALAGGTSPSACLPNRLSNADAAAATMAQEGWRALVPDATFRSGILLLEAERPAARRAEAQAVRAAFHSRGVSLTAYDGGMIRLSMPDRALKEADLVLLRDASRSIA